MADISDSEGFEAWLKGKSPELERVLAARAALPQGCRFVQSAQTAAVHLVGVAYGSFKIRRRKFFPGYGRGTVLCVAVLSVVSVRCHPLRSDFNLLPQDEKFLEEYGHPWETIVDGSQWVLIDERGRSSRLAAQ